MGLRHLFTDGRFGGVFYASPFHASALYGLSAVSKSGMFGLY
jgi:hypothetical protein